MQLEAKNIRFRYGAETILDDFSLTLRPGDFTMLLGPNGGGKSTALKLLAGFLTPTEGDVRLDGVPLSAMPGRERARLLAVVPQSAPPALDFSVAEMVMMGRYARLARMSPPDAGDRRMVDEMLEQLEIAHLRHRSCNRLSGGERQRVAIAAALAQEPRFLLLDEPTSALDPAHALGVMEKLKRLPNAPGILMISHNLNLALQYADRILLLRAGQIYADGTPEEVLTAPNIEAVYHCRAVFARIGEDCCIALKP